MWKRSGSAGPDGHSALQFAHSEIRYWNGNTLHCVLI